MVEIPAVDVVNRLTERWIVEVAGRSATSTAVSGAGLVPVLAALLSGADGRAADELATALGVDATAGRSTARGVLAAIEDVPGMAAALGLWVRTGAVELRPEWVAGLPDRSLGRLTGDPAADRAALDSWADRGTAGLIEHFPLAIDDNTLLVLATAVALRTTWSARFHEHRMAPTAGPWAGRSLPALGRTVRGLDTVSVIDPVGSTPVTRVVVAGEDGVDVHLVLGRVDAPPAAVLRCAFAGLAGRVETVGVAELPDADLSGAESGPGLRIERVPAAAEGSRTRMTTVPFTVTATLDLRDDAGVLGLATACDAGHGHFPGMADRPPLAVQAAVQAVTAEFSAEGFRAAAVTAVGMMAGSARLTEPLMVRQATVTFDRPFAFLVVHRSSGMVLFAGTVTEPQVGLLPLGTRPGRGSVVLGGMQVRVGRPEAVQDAVHLVVVQGPATLSPIAFGDREVAGGQAGQRVRGRVRRDAHRVGEVGNGDPRRAMKGQQNTQPGRIPELGEDPGPTLQVGRVVLRFSGFA